MVNTTVTVYTGDPGSSGFHAIPAIITALSPPGPPNVLTPISNEPCVHNSDAGMYNQIFISATNVCFAPGDSGAPIIDASGRIVGMFNWAVVPQGCDGGGTQADTIKRVLGFDFWYGNDVKDNTIGVFRPSAAAWVVDNGNGKYDGPGPCGPGVPTANTDPCFNYGIGSDEPITGDWDNGTANGIPTNDFTVGVYRSTTDPTRFLLSDTNNPPAIAATVLAGPPSFGYKSVAGKWQGITGATKVGVFRPSTGGWYLDSGSRMIDACGTDYCFFLASSIYQAQAGDIPLAGDWNNVGITSIGLFRRGIGTAPDYFYLSNVNPFDVRNNGTISSWDYAIPVAPGNLGDLPIVGNWTGTVGDKFGIFRPNLAYWVRDNGNMVLPTCAEDQCSYFGSNGDKPVVFGKSIVKAN